MLKNKGHLVRIVFCRYTYYDLSLNSNLTNAYYSDLLSKNLNIRMNYKT